MNIKDKIKVTIITATYNSAATLEQTIASVARQDYPYIEYIIVDGASTDETVDIIRKYEDKILLKWISEPDSGIYDAFNKGIDMATGDYIHFLGSDDSLYNAHTISGVVSQLEEDTDILSAAVMLVDDETHKQVPSFNHHALDRNDYPCGMIPHQGMFTRHSLLKKYRFDTTYKICADYKFFLQCYNDDNIKFKFIDEPVVFFANSGSSRNTTKLWAEDNMICSELGLRYHSPIIYSPNPIKRFIKEIMWKLGILSSVLNVLRQYKYYIEKHFLWEQHTCDNPICRWCGRNNFQ